MGAVAMLFLMCFNRPLGAVIGQGIKQRNAAAAYRLHGSLFSAATNNNSSSGEGAARWSAAARWRRRAYHTSCTPAHGTSNDHGSDGMDGGIACSLVAAKDARKTPLTHVAHRRRPWHHHSLSPSSLTVGIWPSWLPLELSLDVSSYCSPGLPSDDMRAGSSKSRSYGMA